MALIFPRADLDLRPHGIRIDRHERKKSVRGSRGHQLDRALFLEGAKGGEKIPPVSIVEDGPRFPEPIEIHPGGRMKLRLIPRPMHFLLRKLDQPLDVFQITPLQKRIAEHGGQGRRDREGDPKGDPIVQQFFKDRDERNIRFGNGLKEPILFEELRIFGVAHKGKV